MKRQFVKNMLNTVLNKFLKMKVIDSYQQADFFSADLFKALNVTADVIFDVGANVGQCTTSFRKNFPEA
jgi:ubiquinone/menaquinone biosynthesis C-methylase UbiE